MQMGSFANRRFSTTSYLRAVAKALSVLALVAAPAELAAQSSMGTNAIPGANSPQEPSGPLFDPATENGPVQALYLSTGGLFGAQQTPFVDANGNPVVVPVGYEPLVAGSYANPDPMGYGSTYPPAGYDLMEDVGIGGFAVDPHGPHYFDVRGEYVYMQRNTTFGNQIDFTIEDVGGPVVLSSSQLDYGWEPGFRIIGRYDLGPLSVLEFGYMGIYDWHTAASYRDPDEGGPMFAPDLYSLFSMYGTNPDDVSTAMNPMPQTEQSLMHSLALDADFHNAEMSYRRYWVGFWPQMSGTILAGFRYTRVAEDFHFAAFSDEASFDYDLRVRNDLAGFQTGGDLWIRVMQGLRIGTEGKVGIYNNRLRLRNSVVSSPMIDSAEDEFPAVAEDFRRHQAAFITEASVDVVADILPSWSLRAGYEVMYINSIALAGENFNTGPPYPEVAFDEPNPRVPFLAGQGHALFTGFHAGVEYIW